MVTFARISGQSLVLICSGRDGSPNRPGLFAAYEPPDGSENRPYLSWRTFSCQEIAMFNFSMGNLVAGTVFGSIGFVAFIYGKRLNLWRCMFCGLALMVFPYFVENTVVLFVLGGLATASLYFLRD
ncbi:MAG: amino acid transporter [Spartobacteria bacterium]|nr:amino acid transporter [Spartobacteria bacterium]